MVGKLERLQIGSTTSTKILSDPDVPTRMVALLTDLGYNVDRLLHRPSVKEESDGQRLLHSCYEGHFDESTVCRMFALLVHRNLDVNACNGFKETLLHFAVARDLFVVTEWPLQNGARPDLEDANGETPFNHAVIGMKQGVLDAFMRHDYPRKNDAQLEHIWHIVLSSFRYSSGSHNMWQTFTDHLIVAS
jgi:hypothetical protein